MVGSTDGEHVLECVVAGAGAVLVVSCTCNIAHTLTHEAIRTELANLLFWGTQFSTVARRAYPYTMSE